MTGKSKYCKGCRSSLSPEDFYLDKRRGVPRAKCKVCEANRNAQAYQRRKKS